MSHHYRVIQIVGLPGAGKGTQGRILAQVPGFHYSSTGDIFREMDPDSPTGREVHGIMQRGELLPDELAVRLWREQMDREVADGRLDPQREILLLDGIPRTAGQVELMLPDVDVLQVIYLDAPHEEALVERLRERALKEHRADDADEQVIRRRIASHRAQIQGVLDRYPDDVVVRVDAMRSILEVLEQVVHALVQCERCRSV